MAIHAVCTNPKKFNFCKLLFFKEFFISPMLAQTLQLPLHACPFEPTELINMNLIQEKFSSLFTNFDVSTQPRPDGGILLTLRSTEGRVFKRSISYQQLHAGDQLSWVISAIRRDLAEQASELPQISMLQSQQRFALPTYHTM